MVDVFFWWLYFEIFEFLFELEDVIFLFDVFSFEFNKVFYEIIFFYKRLEDLIVLEIIFYIVCVCVIDINLFIVEFY